MSCQEFLPQKTETGKERKGHMEAYGGDGSMYCLPYGDVSWVHADSQTHQIVCIKDVQFFNLNSAIKKKENKTKQQTTSPVNNKTFFSPQDCLTQATAEMAEMASTKSQSGGRAWFMRGCGGAWFR